jgi:predicted nuclease with TOPRIM domain
MANVTIEKEEDISTVIQSLKVYEAHLTEKKENLTNLLNQLETKAKEEIKKRKRKVDRLKSEVLDLQEKCSKFAYWIKQDSTLEFNQATRSDDNDTYAQEPCELKVLPVIPEGVKTTPTEDKGIDYQELYKLKTLSAVLESVKTTPTEDNDIYFKEPDWVKEARAQLLFKETAPTEDKKVMPPKVGPLARFLRSSDKKAHAK